MTTAVQLLHPTGRLVDLRSSALSVGFAAAELFVALTSCLSLGGKITASGVFLVFWQAALTEDPSSLTAQEIVAAVKKQSRFCISVKHFPVVLCAAFLLTFRKVFDRFNLAEWFLAEWNGSLGVGIGLEGHDKVRSHYLDCRLDP